MEVRTLGLSGIQISAISFGAGPVSQLLVGSDAEAQRQTVRQALDLGINWFDTAATYGEGHSEENLGRALSELGVQSRVHLATKVRLMPDSLEMGMFSGAVRGSLVASLRRLRTDRVTLLQIHNAITHRANAQPTSITPAQVLAPGGVLEQLVKLRREGLVEHLGLTCVGEPSAIAEVIACGEFATVQVPYNLLNPSAGQDMTGEFPETNYGNLISECGRRGMGVFAIRVLAGGALAGRPPSPHTLKTKFFPLDLYLRDCQRAKQIARHLPEGMSLEAAAIRFALSHPAVSSAIIGFAAPDEVSQAARFAADGPLSADVLTRLTSALPEGQWGD
jgi:aryl-alcohol dehydrogenase-like predicted oxidoreductase